MATRRTTDLSNDEARRIALAAQGFDRPRPTGRVDSRAFRRVVDRVGLVQLDTVNVFARAHYMPFFSRLGPYDRDALDRFLWGSGRFFEYIGHAASVLPVERYPLLRPRMAGGRRVTPWALRLEREAEVASALLQRVRAEGPITIADVEGERLTGRWWTSEARIRLEALVRTGQLAVAGRGRNFSRVYDLPERVIPDKVRTAPIPGAVEAQRALLRLAVQHLGIGTSRDVADYYRFDVPSSRALLRDMVDAGEVQRVTVDGWREPAFLDRAGKLPRAIEARAIVSPFDPILWERRRVLRLFDFFYQIEIYTPEAKRVYGYYTLPFLLRDRLVGRVDLRAERQAGTLVVRAAHVEDGADPGEVAAELAAELRLAAQWLALDSIEVERAGGLALALARALGVKARAPSPTRMLGSGGTK